MNKVLIGIVVIVLLGVGSFIITNSQKQLATAVVQEEVAVAPTEVMTDDGGATPSAMESKSTTKTFNVIGTPFAFSVKEMRVKQGSTVRVVFKNEEGFHDWVLDEFKEARTKTIKAGESETIEFVADKKGTFEYYCSVGSHRAMGMKGKLIVE